MALGEKCSSLKSKRGVASTGEGLGLGFVRYTRGLGRKRVLISIAEETSSFDSAIKSSLKRQCSEKMIDFNCDQRSRLEALPQDILVSIKMQAFQICVKAYLVTFSGLLINDLVFMLAD